MATYSDSGLSTGAAHIVAAREVFTPTSVAIPQLQVISFKEVGLPNTPQEIKRARRQVMDMLRKSGAPVVLKHQYNNVDVDTGLAKQCPGCFDDDFNNVRNNCKVCFAVGFVSVENDSHGKYIDQRGLVVSGDPGTGIRAPRFGGYSQSHLTWMIQADSSVDVFKPNEQGVMVQTQQAQGYASWFPELHDNDLCINVTVAPDGFTILDTHERFQLKLVNPNTIRGWGSRAVGTVHNVWQTFEQSRAPANTILQSVPI